MKSLKYGGKRSTSRSHRSPCGGGAPPHLPSPPQYLRPLVLLATPPLVDSSRVLNAALGFTSHPVCRLWDMWDAGGRSGQAVGAAVAAFDCLLH
jgi:hypothetical protein